MCGTNDIPVDRPATYMYIYRIVNHRIATIIPSHTPVVIRILHNLSESVDLDLIFLRIYIYSSSHCDK